MFTAQQVSSQLTLSMARTTRHLKRHCTFSSGFNLAFETIS